jgi:hypothetical protein
MQLKRQIDVTAMGPREENDKRRMEYNFNGVPYLTKQTAEICKMLERHYKKIEKRSKCIS